MLLGSNIQAIEKIYENTKVIAFETNEEDFYFIPFQRWVLDNSSISQKVWIDKKSDDLYHLKIVLKPDYSDSSSWVFRKKIENSASVIFPLPYQMQSMKLFLPDEFARIEAEITPQGGGTFGNSAYYRLSLNESELELLRSLSRSGLTLQGSATYHYTLDGTTEATTAPITINIRENDLAAISQAEANSYQWLNDSLNNKEVKLDRVLDGDYSLGLLGGFRIRSSSVVGSFINNGCNIKPDRFEVNLLVCYPSSRANFNANLEFYIPELNANLTFKITATIKMTLNTQSMEVSVIQFDIHDLEFSSGEEPFYIQFLNKLIIGDETKAYISEQLTIELQRTILEQRVFQ